MDSLSTARETVDELLNTMEISRVICVDDVYAQKQTLEDILPILAQLSPDELNRISSEIDEDIAADLPEEIRNEKFRRAWGNLNSEKQQTLSKQILAMASTKDPEDVDDSGAASILEELVGEDKLVPLSLSQWNEKYEEILDSAKTTKTLILFDQDLSMDGGSTTGGISLISNVLASDAADKLLCGLLTHTVTIDNQYEAWEEQSREHGVDRDRFVLIAKNWLSHDPLGFARMLKLVTLSPFCKLLKEKTAEILHQATDSAKEQVGNITVFDFEHIVCRAAHAEGMWEPDMLFRLFGIFHRAEARRRARGTEELEEIARHLRLVSNIPTDSDSSPAITTWKIQQEEMYDAGDYVNKLHLPIDIGDIFKKTDGGSSKSFILLGQPCDLMVRSDGKRYPEINEVMLAEIVMSDEQRPYTEELPYFGDDPTQRYFVKLRQVHPVKLYVLDLCVYNEDGRAVFDFASSCPKGLTPAWKKRFDKSKATLEKMVRKYERLLDKCNSGKSLNRDTLNIISSTLLNDSIFKATFSRTEGSKQIQFNCQRIKRLCRSRATALLAQYAACISRPAFERDLGKPVEDGLM